jgi:hypothetical protein
VSSQVSNIVSERTPRRRVFSRFMALVSCAAGIDFFQGSSRAENFLDVHLANGSNSVIVPAGGAYEVVVRVRANATVSFNAALFLLYATREGSVITDYEWYAPFTTGGIGDFSLGGAPLPLTITQETHTGLGAPSQVADVEFGVFDLFDSSGAGELLRVAMRAPTNAKVGSTYFMGAIPDLFTLGFQELPLGIGTILRVEIGATILGDLDLDGAVGPLDLEVLFDDWGGSGPADLDSDGTVDAIDLALLLQAWTHD